MSTTRVLLSKQLAADAESHHPPLNFLERSLHATFPSEAFTVACPCYALEIQPRF